MRLVLLILFATLDTSLALYKRYYEKDVTKVSHVAHLSGAIAGLLVGIVVLKNRKVQTWETKLKVLCIVTFAIFIGLCMLWNIIADCILQSKCFSQDSSSFYLPSRDYENYAVCSYLSL